MGPWAHVGPWARAPGPGACPPRQLCGRTFCTLRKVPYTGGGPRRHCVRPLGLTPWGGEGPRANLRKCKLGQAIIGNHKKILGNHVKSQEIIRNQRKSYENIRNDKKSNGNQRKSYEIKGNHNKS